jgi:hypothetical protein
MKIESEAVKRVYDARLQMLRRELAEGQLIVTRLTNQLSVTREQVLRIEGAKILTEEMLADVVKAEKEHEARLAIAEKAVKTPETADQIVNQEK